MLVAVGYAVWCFAIALAGGAVGLVLGNLRMPVTLLVASSASAAAGTNIAISAASAVAAAAGHVRGGRVDWRLVAWMAPPTVVAAFIGGFAAGVIPERALLLAIAVVLLYGAYELLRPRPPAPPGDGHVRPGEAVAIGAGVGLLGGLVGLILGSLRLPALIRLGQSPAQAVGTNQVVGAALGIAGLAGFATTSDLDPGLLAAGLVGAVPGSLMGARLTGRLSRETLLRAIAAVLVVSAIAIAARALAP
jgi:uncharacterized membrane protein YfcA